MSGNKESGPSKHMISVEEQARQANQSFWQGSQQEEEEAMRMTPPPEEEATIARAARANEGGDPDYEGDEDDYDGT